MKLQPQPKLQPSYLTIKTFTKSSFINGWICIRMCQHIDNDSRINPLLAAASAQRPLSLCQPLSACVMASSFIKSSSCSSDRSDPPTLTIRLLMQGKVGQLLMLCRLNLSLTLFPSILGGMKSCFNTKPRRSNRFCR